MRRGVVATAILATLAACSGGSADTPPPARSTGSEQTTTVSPTTVPATTSTSLGFETPAVIDVAYVQRVLDEIYRLEGEAARYLYAKKLPDAEFNERLEALFGEPALEEAKSSFGRDAAQGLANLADPPGNPAVKVFSIVDSAPRCIVVKASLSFAPLYKRSAPRSPEVLIQLVRGSIERFNPTPWGVVAAGPPTPTTDPEVC